MKIHTLHIMIPALFGLFLLLQKLFPSRAFVNVPHWAKIGTIFFIVWMTIGALTPWMLPVAWLHEHRLLDGERLGLLGGVLVGWPAWTFVQYWFHRACHRFDCIWRQMHQVHHSPKRMDVFVGVYFHPFEVIIVVLLNNLMTVFIMGLNTDAAAIVAFISVVSLLFIHTSIKTPEWIGYLIYRPESHLLHHQRGVHSGNFCDFPVWDLVFGTFRKPQGVYLGEIGFD